MRMPVILMGNIPVMLTGGVGVSGAHFQVEQVADEAGSSTQLNRRWHS